MATALQAQWLWKQEIILANNKSSRFMLINATIQIVPLKDIEAAFPVIDKAIAIIQQSGIKYSVGAFETTLEGEYETVQNLLRQLEDFCFAQKEIQFLI